MPFSDACNKIHPTYLGSYRSMYQFFFWPPQFIPYLFNTSPWCSQQSFSLLLSYSQSIPLLDSCVDSFFMFCNGWLPLTLHILCKCHSLQRPFLTTPSRVIARPSFSTTSSLLILFFIPSLISWLYSSLFICHVIHVLWEQGHCLLPSLLCHQQKCWDVCSVNKWPSEGQVMNYRTHI